MNKESKTAIGLVVLSNLAMVDAFVAMQPTLSDEQSRQLLASLDKVKALNQDLMKLAEYTTPPAK